MKTNYLKFALVFLILTSCHNGLKKRSSEKEIDTRLVGVWVGSEKGKQMEGVEKTWEMKRNEDGNFVLDFVFIEDGKQSPYHETGTWWTKGGKFYEFHDISGKTDIYEYEVLDDNRVKFSMKKMGVAMNTDYYEFIDTRK